MEKKIILTILVLFLISSFFLVYTEKRDRDPDYQKNWWIVYFEDPKNELNFIIENHSDSNKFIWTITKNRRTIKEGAILIEKGSTQKIDVSDVEKSGKVMIGVESSKDKKRIYRNF